ncbi:AAA family ATPase [Candidatus Woesearchaeota archaeon]|nr:AAA family ATPase [Candidatus Woesearchaeota archaeon]
MLLKKIKLDNIRSYLNQEIIFPEGSILLSGDVGSGKSSILLAIEFALFGISKGYLSGASLLRNGKDKGSVILEFAIKNKNITIKRTLKRSKDTVTQDYGYIEIDGKKHDFSAIELRQAILDLLNYPPESLTKPKSLIYRYTVYTPQEEMKHILISDKDTRLDILRRVFDIDKYKIIKDNTKITLSYIKEKRKELESLTSSLSEKESQSLSFKSSLSDLETEFKELIPLLEKSKQELKKKSEEIKELEAQIKQFNNIKNELSIIETNITNRQTGLSRSNEELEDSKRSLDKVEIDNNFNVENLAQLINNIHKELGSKEEELRNISYAISTCEINIKNSERIKKDIFSLNKCPVCMQDVSSEHKDHINKVEDEKIGKSQKEKDLYTKKQEEIKAVIESFKKEILNIEKQRIELQITKLKIKNNEQKEEKITKLKIYIEHLKQEIETLENKKRLLSNSISEFKDLDYKFSLIKANYENLRQKDTTLEISGSVLKTKISSLEVQLEQLDNEINKQNLLKNKLNNIVIIQNWLETNFINLVENIEKHIMLKINTDFNELFERWFKMLLETENINISLDDSFSPVIDQNGFEIDYENLSGGEKTAAALAYRLALNQVINTLVSTINTKDIIILDEPTDGFSEDQLDKIRLVLNELDTKQTIIVSHESKIESFVDTIIKFNKNNHLSQVIM